MPRYSQRLPWSSAPNALAHALARKRNTGDTLLDLTISNPTEVLPDYPHAAITQAFAAIYDWRYRPDPLGLPTARQFVSQIYYRSGHQVTPSRIALSASTSEAYSLLFKLLCNPGDEVLIPAPSYPLFDLLAGAEFVSQKSYRLRYDGAWHIDFDHLRRQLTPQTRALVVVNPNNPTGSFLKTAETDALAGFVSQNNLALIADEVFAGYEFGPVQERTRTLVDESRCLSFSLNGLSKMAAMPQMKLAWIVVNGPENLRTDALTRLELLLDTYLSVNLPVQAALGRLLEIGSGLRDSIRGLCVANLEFARALTTDAPFTILHVEGGWSLVLHLPRIRSEEDWLLGLLNDSATLVQPGYFFDLEGGPHVVVSLITPAAVFHEGLSRVAAYVRASLTRQ